MTATTTTTYRVETAYLDELPAIAFWIESIGLVAELYPDEPFDAPYVVDVWRRLYRDNLGRIEMATTADGDYVGTLGWTLSERLFSPAPMLNIHWWAVAKAHRASRVGFQLLDHVKATARHLHTGLTLSLPDDRANGLPGDWACPQYTYEWKGVTA